MNRTQGLVIALAAAAVHAFTLTPMMFARHAAARAPLRRSGRALQRARLLATAVPLTELPKIAVGVSTAEPGAWSGDVLAVPLFSAPKAEGEAEAEGDKSVVLAPLTQEAELLDQGALGGAIAKLIEAAEFDAKPGTSCSMWLAGGASRLALLGMGEAPKEEKADEPAGALGASLGAAVAGLAKGECKGAKTLGLVLPAKRGVTAGGVASGLLGALYSDDRFRTGSSVATPPKLSSVDLLSPSAAAAAEEEIPEALALLQGVNLCKDLVNAPPNVLTPQSLAEVASSVAEEVGLECKILERAEIEALGMGCYLGVAQGSKPGEGDPKFIHLSYKPEGEVLKRVSLVGKGLTFDSGGYNLKAGPGSMIEMMKFDMGGSAAVLGAAKAIGLQKPKGVAVDFIVAACENMVSDRAMRPGDILTASNGKKVEVINTDAEGRLTLADALVYAEKLEGPKPDAIVDMATLTGPFCILLK